MVAKADGGRSTQTNAVHISLEGTKRERTEHQTVHLVEDDLLVLEDRVAAEPFKLEHSRSSEIDAANCHNGNLPLYNQDLMFASACPRRGRSWDST